MFSEEKVAQMAARLLTNGGGQMAYIKLIKLLYLADKEGYNRLGESISGDCAVSMPYGPVLSQTYNLISVGSENTDFGWEAWIKDEADHCVSLRRPQPGRDDLDELSENEIEILDHVYHQFGHMSRWQIVDYTHNSCTEWKDPHGSSFPIKPADILRDLGKSEDQIKAMLEVISTNAMLDESLNCLR